MCYFTNENTPFFNEREVLQQKLINGETNLDFYLRLKQLNLNNSNLINKESTIDIETNLRKIMVAFLVLLNNDAFIKAKISESPYLYRLNEFLFELTLCENICNCIKNSKNKFIYLKTKFYDSGFIITIKYQGQKITPRNYLNKSDATIKKGVFFNTIKINFNGNTLQKQKPPKINLDGYILNRLSSVYITLALSGLKRFY